MIQTPRLVLSRFDFEQKCFIEDPFLVFHVHTFHMPNSVLWSGTLKFSRSMIQGIGFRLFLAKKLLTEEKSSQISLVVHKSLATWVFTCKHALVRRNFEAKCLHDT